MVAVVVELVDVRCHQQRCGRLLCRVSPGAVVQVVCRCGAMTQWPRTGTGRDASRSTPREVPLADLQVR
jgi:hypothetical protein